MRITSKWVLGGVAAAALALLLSPAMGGEGGGLTFSLIGSEGEPGGDAGVTLQLDNDDGSAVSAGVDITFADADLTFTAPVADSCVLDASIASTHQIAGRIIEPGVVNVEILVAGTPDPLPTLGNGPLAVCNFTIRGDATEGEEFPVGATNVFIGDALGGELSSTGVDGVITVGGGGGTPTATATATDTVPVPTATATPTGTTPPTPIVCEKDADCPTGQECGMEGTCQPIDCDDDMDCPPGSTCDIPAAVSGEGPIGQCMPLPCEVDDDCPERAVCDMNGMCRPEFCDDNEDCEGDDVCASDGICSSTCDDDSQCDDGVCEDGTCVECRADGDCPAGNTCVNNTCQPPMGGFSLAVSPASQMGVAGGSASIEVVLSNEATSDAADSVSNSLSAANGLSIAACSVAAEIPGGIEGTPGTTVSATLGGPDDSVPTGTIYSCAISIAEDAEGALAIACSDAVVNGGSVSCSAATIQVAAPPTPTPTMMPTATFTMTVIPTETPTNTPVFFDSDDGCAVGPAPRTADATTVLFLLVPALLLWSRRRA